MGKASRAKKERRAAQEAPEPDHLAWVRSGRCMRCGATRERVAVVWCDGCTLAAQKRRRHLENVQWQERQRARREGHVFTAREAGMYRIEGVVKFDDP